jgi:hypothetical protein
VAQFKQLNPLLFRPSPADAANAGDAAKWERNMHCSHSSGCCNGCCKMQRPLQPRASPGDVPSFSASPHPNRHLHSARHLPLRSARLLRLAFPLPLPLSSFSSASSRRPSPSPFTPPQSRKVPAPAVPTGAAVAKHLRLRILSAPAFSCALPLRRVPPLPPLRSPSPLFLEQAPALIWRQGSSSGPAGGGTRRRTGGLRPPRPSPSWREATAPADARRLRRCCWKRLVFARGISPLPCCIWLDYENADR